MFGYLGHKLDLLLWAILVYVVNLPVTIWWCFKVLNKRIMGYANDESRIRSMLPGTKVWVRAGDGFVSAVMLDANMTLPLPNNVKVRPTARSFGYSYQTALVRRDFVSSWKDVYPRTAPVAWFVHPFTPLCMTHWRRMHKLPVWYKFLGRNNVF